MIKSTKSKPFPAWLRGLGWSTFGILAVATVLVIARSLLMSSGHQTARRFIDAQAKKPVARRSLPPAVAGSAVAGIPGIPLASIPYFGGILTGDKETWEAFSKKLEDVRAFFQYERTHAEQVDGVFSFRAILQNKGIDVPETMTEAEAAAEYLRQADRFSILLAQWREAVAKGPLEPLDAAATYKTDPTMWRFGSISLSISQLLTMTAEARLQSGDVSGAWADWQAMNNYTARKAEYYRNKNGYGQSMEYTTLFVAQSGMLSGAWTDDQLAEISSVAAEENALAAQQRNQDRYKKSIRDYYMNFHEHEEDFGRNFLNTPSQFDQMVNQMKLKLITEQQIRDNMEVRLAEVDRQLSRFDPETGFYVAPTEKELKEPQKVEHSPGLFGSFYFMINDLWSGNADDQATAGFVIQQQSQYDQIRLAAALETYQHRTGKYPDHLEAVSNQFPGGAPLDIATGQPYFYQRNADGGYTLWGAGIDGKSNGGDEKADVTWRRWGRTN